MRSDTPHRVEIGERRWPTTPVLATGLRRANGGDGHGRAAPGLPNGAGMGYRLMILYKPSPKVGKNPPYASEGLFRFSCSHNTLQHLATAILAEKRHRS